MPMKAVSKGNGRGERTDELCVSAFHVDQGKIKFSCVPSLFCMDVARRVETVITASFD